MIVRISFIHTDAQKYEEGKKIWDKELAPLLKKQKGFLKAYRADARDEPGGVVIQFWDTREAEEVWRSSLESREVARKLKPLAPELPIDRDFVVKNQV
ncbi:MAG: antibiotic biosynthesis monooxygenase [Chloroflexi bacterium]|nr:antibiotic biosynthesis monooxygenase [Chloroflexota bacterium]